MSEVIVNLRFALYVYNQMANPNPNLSHHPFICVTPQFPRSTKGFRFGPIDHLMSEVIVNLQFAPYVYNQMANPNPNPFYQPFT
jgi:hypothetical protein